MGRIINMNSWEGEELPDVLSRTGAGGFLSTGYLADEPAIALIEDDETIQYVVTNRKRGVAIESGGSTTRVKPDRGHRTVVVVTDRRLLVVVGHADGDEHRTIGLEEVTEVAATTGRRNSTLTVTHADDTTWQIPTGKDGLDAVVSYLRDATDAWREGVALLEAVEAALSEARQLREAGTYDRALSTVRAAGDDIEAVRARARGFSEEYPGNALHERTQGVVTARAATLGAVRVSRGKEASVSGDRLFRTGNYEDARAAFERAREEYEAALTEAGHRLDDPEGIRAERDRVDRLVSDIAESPLPDAITADRAAVAADDAVDAAAHWETALSAYRRALAAAEGEGESLFRGDPDQLRDRISTVSESLVAAQRTVGEDARRAGDWYTDAQQYEVALEEFEAAAEAFDAALETATESYPDAVPHLEADIDALQRRTERAQAAHDGEDPGEDRIESDDDPGYEMSATLGTVDGPTEIEAAIEPPVADGPSDSPAERLRRLDGAAVVRVVGDALETGGCATEAASPRSPFDLIATRGGDRIGVVVSNSGVTADRIVDCGEVAGAAGTDAVLLATTAEASADIEQQAAAEDVRLLDGAFLATLVDSGDLTLPRPVR